jgi:N-acetylglutamate synthase-like GNAT family acetyltransferase
LRDVSSQRVPRIRPATAADGGAIRAIVSEARLNPRDLDWRRFLVADDAGAVVACAQVRELASVAVLAVRRGEGIGRRIAQAAIAREPVRPLYVYTESRTEDFWARLGFAVITGDAVPRDLRGPLRIARVAMRVLSLVARRRYRIVVMRRDAT